MTFPDDHYGPFLALGEGRYAVVLPADERRALARLLREARTLLDQPDDPSLQRLFPVAFPDDPEAERDYRELMGADLLRSRFSALERVEATLDVPELDEDDMTAWIQSVNALRLVIGTRLGVTSDEIAAAKLFESLAQEGMPDARDRYLYYWLTELLGSAVEAAGGPPADEGLP